MDSVGMGFLPKIKVTLRSGTQRPAVSKYISEKNTQSREKTSTLSLRHSVT